MSRAGVPSILREEVGQTFSDIWYRIGPMRPRLSPHAQVVRQHYGPSVSFIVEDPAGGQYYRMSESAYFFVGLLDGRRTVDEAWQACNAQLGDGAPTQRECVEVLGKLQLFGLLLGDLPLAADMVLERAEQARATRIKRRTGNWMFYSIPLFNPEPFLERYKHIARAVFSRWGAVVWLLVVAVALAMVAMRADRLGDPLNHLLRLDPSSVVLIGALFLFLRAAHELGHAAACKALGGRSTEIGVIMIAGLLPLPYCDATSAWRMPETWKRVLVSAAGMIVETFIAAVAAIVWALTDETRTVHGLAFTTMVVSGVTTILFNINPLLRYDGYYMLSDLAGSPNLAQRSRELWAWLVERYAFGVRSARPPRVRDAAEARLLALYGAAAVPYRVFIGVLILTILANRYLTLGVVLAILMGLAWLVWPVLKGLSYIAGSPRLVGRRARAAAVVAGSVGLIGGLLGLVPAPAAGYAGGTLEPVRIASLRAGEDGFVVRILKSAGEEVAAGEPVMEMENPDLEMAEAQTAAQLRGALARLDHVIQHAPDEVDLARVEFATLEARLGRVREQIARLVVAAPVAGRIATAPGAPVHLDDIQGRFVQRGALLGVVVSDRELVARAMVSDDEQAYIFGRGAPPRASIRVRGEAGREVPGEVIRVAPAGSRELTSRALAAPFGGDVAIDPTSTDRPRALAPGFVVEVRPVADLRSAQPGLRARVRFGVEPEPLLRQWWRKGRQFFMARLHQ